MNHNKELPMPKIKPVSRRTTYVPLARRHPVRPDNRGFSVIELSVVIAIIATLTGIAAIGFSQVTKNAQGAACSANLQKINTATMAYWTLNGSPADDATWAAGIQTNLDGRVVNTDVKCPSGGTYTVATRPTAGASPDLPTCSIYSNSTNQTDLASAGLHHLK